MYGGFSLELLRQVRCPDDGAELILDGAAQDPVTGGEARCRQCGALYPVRGGILLLMSRHEELNPICATEIVARDREADIYHNYCTPAGDFKEVPPTLAMLGPLAGKSVLELGCGTGRYSVRIAEQAAEFLGVDYSLESLRLLARTMPPGRGAGLVMADATSFKTAPRRFDLVLSAQMLQHLPTAKLRDGLYREIARQLRPGGHFVCNAYHYHLSARLQGLPREGRHESGIFYHRFSVGELAEEVGHHLAVLKAHPISIHVPFSGRLSLDDAWLSRRLERIPLVNALGELVLLKAQNTNCSRT
ncbi:hypothetical protein GMSM_08790 [Geomonas sp. Red276]